jgi:pimeloyl-ACP methyl ester carboxylesterase
MKAIRRTLAGRRMRRVRQRLAVAVLLLAAADRDAPSFFAAALVSRPARAGAGSLAASAAAAASSPSGSSLLGAAGLALPPGAASEITEPACLDAIRRLRAAQVPVPGEVHPDGRVSVTYARWPAQQTPPRAALGRWSPPPPPPAVVLVHGFDSSCLEYRRLGPRLAERGIDAYAVDLLGWGFSQLGGGVATYSAQAKIQALRGFLETVVVPSSSSSTYVIAGASLGGAAAIEVAADDPSCRGLVLLDAQGFVDGIGPMSLLPAPLAGLGAEVLKSVPLRSSANQMSYRDKERYATDEAVAIGRLHCLRDGWKDALVSFMRSGGFSPSSKVPAVAKPSLVLWGRQDEILDGEEFANKFVETLPDARLSWVEECGHVPHLEQPDVTADAVAAFVRERVLGSSPESGVALGLVPSQLGAWGLAAAGATAFMAGFAADFLPVH